MELEEGPISDLVALGLARYEARVYLGLIRRDSYTAAEVAREADVPRQRVYDVLDALVRRRLVTTHPGRVATYSAVTPELAVARLMALQRESVDRLERVSEGLAAVLQPLWSDGRVHTDPLDYIEILRDPKAIAERFADIQQQAQHELLTFCKPPSSRPRRTPKESRSSAGCTGRAARSVPSTSTTRWTIPGPWSTYGASPTRGSRPASPPNCR